MSTITVTSSVRAVDLPSEGWASCCGQTPDVFTWPRGMGKAFIGITCRNPACSNAGNGVLAYKSEAAATWDRWRRQEARDA